MTEWHGYQDRTHAEVLEQARAGKRSILVVAPTGAGKTKMAVRLLEGGAAKGRRILWLAHREELIEQAADSLRAVGLRPAVIAPWAPADSTAPVLVASLQTLLARGHLPPADIVVPDEAHHHVAGQWTTVVSHYRAQGAMVLGLTATPERTDGVAMGNVFDAMVIAAQPREVIAAGRIVPARVLGPPAKQRDLTEDPLVAYQRFGLDKRAIVFCASVSHAAKVAHAFNAFGIPAQSIDGKTGDKVRGPAIRKFKRGELRVLTNVHVLTEGFDVPGVEMIILARGFSSVGAYLQAVGRGLRADAGKTECVVFDARGSTTEHGLPGDDRMYSLEGKPIRGADGLEPIRQCPECGHVFRASEWRRQHTCDDPRHCDCALLGKYTARGAARCPGCGFEMPVMQDPRVRRAIIQEITAAHVDTQRTEFLRKQLMICRAKGWKPGKALVMYKVAYHHWPSEQQKKNAGWYAAQNARVS